MNALDAWCLAIDIGSTVAPVFDWLVAFIRQIGPGAIFIGAAGSTWWGLDLAADTVRDRLTNRGIRRLEHYANHPGARAINNPPREEDSR